MNHFQNLVGPLEQVTASYRAVRPRSARKVSVTQRADQLAAWVALSLDEPAALKNLHDEAAELRDVARLSDALPRIAEGAMTLIGAEFGNIQFLNPLDDSLVLVTQSGFKQEFLDHFAVVHDNRSVCGRAARQCAQAVTPDVREDPAFTPHQKTFRAAGVRAVQSTPLVDRAGRLVGVISTHASQPGRPSDQDLWTMQLYAQLAGEAVARHLAGPRVDGHPADLPHNSTDLYRRAALLEGAGPRSGVTHWVYRVDEPCGSEGCRMYGVHPAQWRGRMTTDSPGQDAEYVAALVVRELMADWDMRGLRSKRPVHVHVWRGWEGTLQSAAFTMELQPDPRADRPPAVDAL
ncbi:GAF domain-containing protein [Streptomyces broussonetiae]|uniref:GAF domain-containing protein n=1 Tax=Streptomyces broussonetiae TaxID=2686304 RepID=A0A6I6NC85_9ACTN|nr:GAF domain-containing protein [Streptomyces broussonetiae]QHA05896.1 GAF domain-containing protein [Streptomyces broussonetiae]